MTWILTLTGVYSSLVIIPFEEVGYLPTNSPETEHTDQHEDNFIVDCVLETQNMDQSLSQAGDAIDIMANMSKGKEDHLSHTPKLLASPTAVGVNCSLWRVGWLPNSSTLTW